MIKGDFDYGQDSEVNPKYFTMIFYFITSFILNVILLNVLVALMSDSYEEIMTNQDEIKNRMLNNLILKIDFAFFWNRNK